ncbi:hypothetical protein ES705_30156 [subsurface metagenome]
MVQLMSFVITSAFKYTTIAYRGWKFETVTGEMGCVHFNQPDPATQAN